MASLATTISNSPYSDLAKRTNNKGQIDYSGLQPGQYFDPTGKVVGGTQIPSSWDTQTYSNFKKANPTLEPNAQDTAVMLGTQGINPSATSQVVANANLTPNGSAASVNIPAVTQTEKDRQVAIDNLLKINQADANSSVDPSQIYQNQLAQFQDQINATNSVYNDQLNQARIAGLGRLGSNRAQQARGGLLGSDFGTAQENTINDANDQVNQSIQDERSAAISALQNQARQAAVNDLAVKTAAKKAGAQAVADYYNTTEPQLRTSRASQVASSLIAQGIDPSTLSPDQLTQLTTDWNLTEGDISSAYKTAKNAQAKTDADLLKAQNDATGTDENGFTLSEGQQRYVKNSDGSYSLAASVDPKAVAPTAPKTLETSAGILQFDEKTGTWIPTGYQPYRAPTTGDNSNRVLSATEAQSLGVPFGTTAAQAYGITPTKPLTETQAKDQTYADRSTQANEYINNLESTVSAYNPLNFALDTAAEAHGITNAAAPDNIKQLRQAERNFVTAVLRRESGAAISSSEFTTAEKQYFPQPGDDTQTLAQKAQNRQTAINSFVTGAGASYKPATNITANDTEKNTSDPLGIK